MPTDPRVLADFAGSWRLRKTITQADGLTGEFQGTAIWRAEGPGAKYSESGSLKLGESAPLSARRRYRWNDTLEVFFEDGRLFHRVPPLGGAAGHWCDPDQYDVTYDFTAWPAFQVNWRVTGPRKDYCMTCQYTRR